MDEPENASAERSNHETGQGYRYRHLHTYHEEEDNVNRGFYFGGEGLGGLAKISFGKRRDFLTLTKGGCEACLNFSFIF